MPRFKVQIDERFTHEMLIEAASAEDAIDKAYDLLRDGIARDPKLQEEYDYDFNATEYLEDYAEQWD